MKNNGKASVSESTRRDGRRPVFELYMDREKAVVLTKKKLDESRNETRRIECELARIGSERKKQMREISLTRFPKDVAYQKTLLVDKEYEQNKHVLVIALNLSRRVNAELADEVKSKSSFSKVAWNQLTDEEKAEIAFAESGDSFKNLAVKKLGLIESMLIEIIKQLEVNQQKGDDQ